MKTDYSMMLYKEEHCIMNKTLLTLNTAKNVLSIKNLTRIEINVLNRKLHFKENHSLSVSLFKSNRLLFSLGI